MGVVVNSKGEMLTMSSFPLCSTRLDTAYAESTQAASDR